LAVLLTVPRPNSNSRESPSSTTPILGFESDNNHKIQSNL
jgi:hypothetical protein